MGEDSVLNIILKFLVDSKSQADAKKAVADMGKTGAGVSAVGPSGDSMKTWQAVNDYAKSFGVSVGDAMRGLAGMGSVGQKTEQQIRADYDAMQQLGAGTSTAAENMQNLGRQADSTFKTIQHGGALMAGFMLARAGGYLTRLGQGVLTQPINAYAKYAGLTAGASAQWLDAQRELEASTVRIGGVLTSQVAPVMGKIAGLSSQVASLLEKYPGLGSLVAGGALTALIGGAGLRTLGEIITTLAAFKLAGGMALLSGAGKALTGAGVTAPIAGGAALAGAANLGLFYGGNRLGAYLGEKVGLGTYQQQLQNLGQAATIAAYDLGGLLGKQNEWAQAIGRLTGAIDQAGQKTAGAAASADQVNAYISYQKQTADAEKQTQEERARIIQEGGAAMLAETQKFEQDRAALIADAAENATKDTMAAYREEQQAQVEYYVNQAKMVRDAGREAERAEEDHLKRVAELQADHNDRMLDLADKRDALGMWREMRDYEKQRSRDEQNYQVETARRNQDLAVRLADMDAEFQRERALRMQNNQLKQQEDQAQLEKQLKQLDANHKAEMDQIKAQEQKKLTDLQTQSNRERAARYTAFAQQLRDLNAFLGQETQQRAAYYDYWTKQFQAFIGNNKGLVGAAYPLPGHAMGGYSSGLTWTGEEGYEYILSHRTTTLLEKLAGNRRLTQSNVIGLLASGGSKAELTYNDHRRFDSKLSAQDRRQIQRDTGEMLTEALGG